MKCLAFDTETTGLISNMSVRMEKQPEIIEFYGCIFDDETFEITEEYDVLIKPKGTISPEITKITGITPEMVVDALPFEAHAAKIKSMIESVDQVIAHNLGFDKEMVELEMKRQQLAVDWPILLCTVEATTWLNGYRLSLSSLYEHLFLEKFTGAHRAKVDVQALVKCYQELCRRELV